MLHTNEGQLSILQSILGNWPILVTIFGIVALFVIARRSIQQAKSGDVNASAGSRWADSDLASDEDLLAKYPPPGAEPRKPEAKSANLDDFFSNTARQQDLKGAAPE